VPSYAPGLPGPDLLEKTAPSGTEPCAFRRCVFIASTRESAVESRAEITPQLEGPPWA